MTQSLFHTALAASLTLALPPAHADRNQAEKSYRQGLQAEHGEGIPMDKQQAFAHYCEAAKASHAGAMHNLGWMYLNGRGVKTNEAKAGYWLNLAAGAGDAHARRLLKRLVLPSVGKDEHCLLTQPKRVKASFQQAKKGAPKAPPPKPQAYCGQVGPLGDETARGRVIDWLADQSVQAQAVRRSYPLGLVYQVYRVPLEARRVARDTIRDYQNRGISDIHLITGGSLKNGVSLGAYRLRENAEKRVKHLQNLGIEADYRTQSPIHEQSWVWYRSDRQMTPTVTRRFPALIHEHLNCEAPKPG